MANENRLTCYMCLNNLPHPNSDSDSSSDYDTSSEEEDDPHPEELTVRGNGIHI